VKKDVWPCQVESPGLKVLLSLFILDGNSDLKLKDLVAGPLKKTDFVAASLTPCSTPYRYILPTY